MPDLSIAIDVGGSSTKIIYQSAAMAEARCWYMPPEIEPISAAQLERFFELQAGMGNLNPSLHAWVKLDDQLWVVGKMAHHFMPDDRIHEKKYENALYKVLAIVGVLLEVQKLQKSRALTLRLAMVLPMDEFGDRKRLQTELERLLKGFDCRGQRYKVKLEQFLCRPEGAGLMAFYLQKFPKQFAADSVGFLMLGHRNVTGLRFEAGELRASDSPMLGFAGVLDQVVGATSGIRSGPLSEALVTALREAAKQIYQPYQTQHPNWGKLPAMQALISVKQPALRQAELAELDRAIQAAIQDYWVRLERWLTKVFPGELDALVIGGGAAPFLQPELEKQFNYPPTRLAHDYHARSRFTDRGRHSTQLLWWTLLPPGAADAHDRDEALDAALLQDGRSIDVRGLFTLLTEAD